MSIASEITRINTNISNAYTAAGNKGATLPVAQNSANLANTINSIPTGSPTENDVNFYDYDGTLVKSYSKSEFLALTSLPSNPTHTGLTSQGWNWSLSDAKTYVTSYNKLNIGQMYVTDDNKTRIYITLEEGRLEPYLGFAVNGTLTIDWGDGNTENVTGSATDVLIYTQHTYSNVGNYIIKISSNDNVYLIGQTMSSILGKNSSVENENIAYLTCIKKIELGNNIIIGSRAFHSCYALKSITIPNEVTAIGSFAFMYCYALESITIPNGVTTIEERTVAGCYTLKSITIPNGVTTIGNAAFYDCYASKNITIPNGVTTIGDSAFYDCYTLKSITIPNSVTTLGSQLCRYCYALESITIPNGVTNFPDNMLSYCYSLTNITLSNSVTSLGNNVFYYCYSLTNITLSNTITTIGTGILNACRSLYRIVVPNEITTITANTFNNCQGMKFYDFSNFTSIPTLANKNAFNNIPNDCKIVVPDSLYTTWKESTNWSNYTSYIIKASEV